MNAIANAAAKAPNAAAPSHKDPLDMSDDEFDAHLKRTKVWGAKAEAARVRRRNALTAIADIKKDPALLESKAVGASDPALADHPIAQKNAASWPDGKKKPATPALVKPQKEDLTDRLIPLPAEPQGLVTRYIDPEKIDIREGWNARVDFGDIEELAASIKAQKKLDGHGLINDIRVKETPGGRYELIDGERRLHSVMHLISQGEEFAFGIPAKVEPAEATDADLIIKMFTANMGKPFLPYEEAQYYARLKASGMTIKDIEAKTGRSDNSIVGALALLEADDDLVEAVVKGGIGATLGKSIAVNVRGNKARQKELTAKAKAASKSGDKKAMKAVKKEIDDERRAKAAKKMPGKQLKARMLDEHDIATIGAATGARLKDVMEMVGLPFDTDMAEWVSDDRELQIAANFGALVALRAVMGDKTAKVEF